MLIAVPQEWHQIAKSPIIRPVFVMPPVTIRYICEEAMEGFGDNAHWAIRKNI
jgi:hypothetical protein